jgi:Protein of unknown function (DUF3631)
MDIQHLATADHARLNTYMVEIAAGARGVAIPDGAGNYRFGSNSGGLCLYASGQFHDYSGGAREHGYNAFQLIEHLYPKEDAFAWARDWLVRHPSNGSFIAGDGESVDDFAEVEAMAFIESLYNGAPPIDDTYITRTRGLPLRPEDQAQLRWVADFRGEEGALLAPVTDDDGKLVKLLVIHITRDGKKSPHSPSRIIIRGAKRPGLCRFGTPGPNVVEAESVEKGLAARAAGAEYVVVVGGVSNIGRAPLPPVVQSVVIPRDNDPAGSLADQALWRGVVRRLSQGLNVAVTARPNDIAPTDAPLLKDLDDVYRYDHDLVSVLLKGANLKHGRLGEAVDNAILEEALRLNPVALGRARGSIAGLLGVAVGALDVEFAWRNQARKETKPEEEVLPGQALTYPPVNPWPDPVDGAELLTEISATLPHYVRLSRAEYDAAALGMVHSHVFDFFDVMPIVTISSPQKRSGKTRLMRLAARVSPKALFISGNTAAFLVRAIDRDHPNVFADEFDAVTKGDPEKAEAMRAHINALFDREGSYVGKCVPTENGHEPRRFTVWSTLWLAGIKKPPPTIEDRAIRIQPKRKLPGDKVKSLRLRDGPEFDVFRRKAARFAIDSERALRNANPSCPDGLAEYSDRAADAWSPLFAIADVAGGDWLERAHRAALILSGLQDDAGDRGEAATDADDELALLMDVRTILLAIDALAPEAKDLRADKQIAVKALMTARSLADAGKEPDKPPKITPVIGGEQLANALGLPALFPDRSWSEWAHGRPIKSHHIVAILREYGILSKTVRFPDSAGVMWGFSRDALDDAFSRYVPSPPIHPLRDKKSAYRPYSTENVEENAKKSNPYKFHASPDTPGETHGDASNPADFEVGKDPATDEPPNPLPATDEPLTSQTPPLRPHDEPVNIPKGATRRSRTVGPG